MAESVSFNIYVPSYKRYDRIITKNILNYCTYVVRKSEEQLYRDAGVDNLIAVEDEEINSMVKVFQWIIDNAKEDVFVYIDDDIQDLIYRLDKNEDIGDPDKVTAEIERIGQIIYDLGIGMAGTDVTPRPFGYDREFAFTGIVGGLVWINKAVYKAKIDTSVEFNDDCDKVLQELLHNRIILKPKYLCMKTTVDMNSGGSQDYKTRQGQIDSIQNMKIKWGKYFEYDFKKNTPKIMVKR